jgi:hypothetical protein
VKLSAKELLFIRNASLVLALADILGNIWAARHYDNLVFITAGMFGLIPFIVLIFALAELWPRVYFQEQIGIHPPQKGDWQAVIAAREMANEKERQIKKRHDWLVKEEDGIAGLLGIATPEQLKGLLRRIKDARSRISKMDKELKTFKSVMKRFCSL